MGITTSKTGLEDNEKVATGSVPSTPILTPKQKKPSEEILDPRSPSFNIIRTPIQSTMSPFTPEADTFNINSPALIQTVEDPRSPSLAFTRTPIAIVEETDLLRRVHKKNLDNIKKVLGDMPTQVPPRLLESSPMKPKLNETKRKSLIGLLETNLDFVETDLDVFILNKTKSQHSLNKSASPSKAELKAKFLQDFKNEDERTEDICKISQGPKETVVEEPLEEVLVQNENVTEAPRVQTDVDDDGLIISETALEKVEITPKKDSIDRVQEFEKKVNNLIYTDEDHIITMPTVNKTATHQSDSRTPLGTRNGNNAQQTQLTKKTIPKLRVSDKPRRTDYAVSKIPVYKTKNTQQCENTPPRNMLDAGRKPKRAQWDNDHTLII